ncbi:MAG: hypothetical protein DRP14_01670 [Candidatus Aenigmatarchaeota archaeon]|nr:MAG: hypothetical protein DRP14_01670 [Candidatus Aenigmarchaeota archaeon]
MPDRYKNKGLLVEIFFFLFGLLFSILFVGSWQQMGMSMATERMSELKVNTVTQIKNILLLMEIAPVKTHACVSLRNCNKITIHSDYIEIWGPANNYLKEGEYLSNSLVGNLNLYEYNETCAARGGNCDLWNKLTEEGYTTACNSFICFEKVNETSIHILSST